MNGYSLAAKIIPSPALESGHYVAKNRDAEMEQTFKSVDGAPSQCHLHVPGSPPGAFKPISKHFFLINYIQKLSAIPDPPP